MDLVLVRVGMGIFATLGALHLLYTLLDLTEPKRLAPKDPNVLIGMKNTRIRMRKKVRNFWRSYVGFNLSHGLGLLVFSGIFTLLTFSQPSLVFTLPFGVIMIATSAVYAILSYFFWFSIPFVGSMTATALVVSAVVVH